MLKVIFWNPNKISTACSMADCGDVKEGSFSHLCVVERITDSSFSTEVTVSDIEQLNSILQLFENEVDLTIGFHVLSKVEKDINKRDVWFLIKGIEVEVLKAMFHLMKWSWSTPDAARLHLKHVYGEKLRDIESLEKLISAGGNFYHEF